jgi:hypothetical protein
MYVSCWTSRSTYFSTALNASTVFECEHKCHPLHSDLQVKVWAICFKRAIVSIKFLQRENLLNLCPTDTKYGMVVLQVWISWRISWFISGSCKSNFFVFYLLPIKMLVL